MNTADAAFDVVVYWWEGGRGRAPGYNTRAGGGGRNHFSPLLDPLPEPVDKNTSHIAVFSHPYRISNRNSTSPKNSVEHCSCLVFNIILVVKSRSSAY